MKPYQKILFITSFIIGLNWYLGFDWRFTIINFAWLILIASDWIKEYKNKNKH